MRRRGSVAGAFAALALACGEVYPDPFDAGPCAVPFDDGNACTIDWCPTAITVRHDPIDPDDGNPCTIDGCDPATGPYHLPAADDGNPCTIDSCDPATGAITHTPVPVDDGNPCTLDACDPATGAITHTPIPVNDGIACTVDTCDPVLGPVHTPDSSLCPAGQFCNVAVGCVSLYSCDVSYPPFMDALAGQTTPQVDSWIAVLGLTDSPGQGAGIVADVGWGLPGADPTAGYTWFAASYNYDFRTLFDVYSGTMLAPAAPGTYDYLYRVSLDARANFTYCDVLGIYDPLNPNPGILTVR